VPFRILVVNPGSTSTKLALFDDDRLKVKETLGHSSEDLDQFAGVWDQYSYRLDACRQWASGCLTECSAVAAIGGLLRPVEGGIYRINAAMLQDARSNSQGEHASNLGCALACDLASSYHAPSFIVDPVSVDEMQTVARYSGHPLIERRSFSHALNIHAAARKASAELRIPLQDSSFVVGHLGGGVSIAPVRSGRIIDVNDAASDGPFSPERTGGLPLQPFIRLCMSGKFTERELSTLVMGKGGLTAYLGTNSIGEVDRRIDAGDAVAQEVFEAMAYQIAKEIGSMATVLSGNVQAVVLTGGAAHSKRLVSWVEDRVRFIAPVKTYPGEDEMQSMAESVLGVLRGVEGAKEY
jgi:butyrate kinase